MTLLDCKYTKSPAKDESLDLAAVRARLARATGKEYWRSLDELAGSPQFEELLHREFPRQASEWMDPVGRRGFLKLMAASLALAGLTGCGTKPKETIVPYARAPEEVVPGKPLFFATAMTLNGAGIGLLVESHEGRPTKIEGNPDHPGSLGATDIFAQASLLGLYDPDRSQVLTYLGDIRPWGAFLGETRLGMDQQRVRRGAGFRILTETVVSPTLAGQIKSLLVALPEAKWHQWEPCGRDAAREGSRLAFGRYVNTIYRVEKADVIVSLDADFLCSGAGSLRYAREFARRRRPQPGKGKMNRLYAIESTPSNTGAMADHRLSLRASEIEEFARALAGALGVTGAPSSVLLTADQAKWLTAVARDVSERRGSCLVVAGDQQSAAVHAWAHTINQALGNVGSTVIYTDPVEAQPINQTASLGELKSDIDAGRVELLLILGGNPVYNAPADMRFGERLLKVPKRIHLSLYHDETSALCQWHVPEAHYLESWSDTRAFDGTASIVQPLIAPLYGGKSAHEVLAVFTDQPERSGYDLVRDHWKTQHPGGDFEQFWRKSLNDGVIAGTTLPPIIVSPRISVSLGVEWAVPEGRSSQAAQSATDNPAPDAMEIVFRPDPSVFDGRFANNGWLQELPKPLTKLTWDNAALISPATAERLGLSYRIRATGGEHGQVLADVIELEARGRKLRIPAWIVPGQPDGCVTLHFGYGRAHTGQIGRGAGFNAYALRTSAGPWFASGAVIRKTGERYPLACTQFHHNMEGREPVRAATLEEFRRNPEFAHEQKEAPPKSFSLYPEHKYSGYAWGMSIDLNACVGCNACVVACQAENNIPVVGKTEVMRGREMHWLRVDRYYRGALESPETYFQPLPCMHCENAPCELVCPVGATVHSAEGLNDMVYNRCVGTRYCSNNCPYKVRRFNFLQYSDWETPSLKLGRNPNVTVRSRGVMEKCTYCVQRINAARIDAEKENRAVRDGEIVTACQAACPAEAIIFGNINDPRSRVARLKSEPRDYSLLGELNTQPRTTYLAAVRNPNPELEKAKTNGR